MPKAIPEILSSLGRSLEQAVALHRQGRLNEAEGIYRRILKSAPNHLPTLQLMAQLKMQQGKPEEASRLMRTAVAAQPDSADALAQLGFILRALGREGEALAHFDRALAIAPHHVDALGGRGDILLSQQRPEEALQCFDKILARTPNHAGARASRGVALAKLKRYAEALAQFDAVLAAAPQHAMALYNRANVLADFGRSAEALVAYDRLLAFAPQHAAAWNNRANALMALKRHAEAVASFDRAIALKPDFADAHFNRSLALLALGDYVRGFAAYEWRWKRTGMPAQRAYGRPLWLGQSPLQGRTILVHAEQGLGDSIQFARYVPLLAQMGAAVLLEAQPELKTLLARLAGAARVFARGEALASFDVHCPLGSLPLAFKTELSNVPAAIPYLYTDPRRVEAWRPRIEALARPRCALVWAGNINHANDRNRSIPFGEFRPLWEAGATRFVSLQRDVRAADAEALGAATGVLHVGEALADFDDTAAVIALCDLVIAVDTAVAHLAAALGKPTWVLLPFSPDWRWTLEGERSPWYPAARLFRQPQLGDWASVIARVRGELIGFATQR